MSTKDVVTAYLAAIEAHRLDEVAAFQHPELEVIEHPNKLNPAGKRDGLAEVRAAGERGAALMASERYAIRALIAEGDRAAVTMAWTGTLHDGRELRAQICTVIELRDGKVWKQEQFDCFDV